jgi:hypothetical protein
MFGIHFNWLAYVQKALAVLKMVPAIGQLAQIASMALQMAKALASGQGFLNALKSILPELLPNIMKALPVGGPINQLYKSFADQMDKQMKGMLDSMKAAGLPDNVLKAFENQIKEMSNYMHSEAFGQKFTAMMMQATNAKSPTDIFTQGMKDMVIGEVASGAFQKLPGFDDLFSGMKVNTEDWPGMLHGIDLDKMFAPVFQDLERQSLRQAHIPGANAIANAMTKSMFHSPKPAPVQMSGGYSETLRDVPKPPDAVSPSDFTGEIDA